MTWTQRLHKATGERHFATIKVRPENLNATTLLGRHHRTLQGDVVTTVVQRHF